MVTEVWTRRYLSVCIAVMGLRDLTPLLIWLAFGTAPQTAEQRVSIAAGLLILILAAALWAGRGIRPALLASVPVAVVATALGYRVALAERGIVVASRQALPVWAGFAIFAVIVGYGVRWMWRQAPRAAP